MGTSTYAVDMDDMRFVLFEQFKVGEAFSAAGIYPDYDADTLGAILDEGRRVAEEVIAPVNRASDAEGATFDGAGNVSTPDSFKEAWRAMADGGWIGVTSPPEFGGAGMPHVVHVASNEMFFGASCAFMMYAGLTAAAARVLSRFGPAGLESMSEMMVRKLLSGEWGGTMCLTEAGAGSDVGANRCKATRTDEPGVYLLEGEKIFISGGDQDLTSNILHLVLARTPDAPGGTKGISIFMVPKFHFDADGNLGERNSAWVGNIEHKMGINGSATCTLLLGDRGPCKAWLLGREGEGMPIMFHMMNEARLGVAIQSLGVAAHAYENALSYCRERKQGGSVERFRDADAPRVAIVEHPDVRRMLLWQRAHVHAMRSLCLRLGLWGDLAERGPEADRAKYDDMIDLLTPIAKAHCSDIAYESATLALQCFGGYGFIREYTVEQHVRDTKIFSIYEGTNGIQAMDLLGRKMRLKGGQVFMQWMADASASCAAARAVGLTEEANAIEKAVQQVGATAMHLAGLGGQGKLAQAMGTATPFLRQMGTVVFAIEALEQATAAKHGISADGETPTRRAKLHNLRFYVSHVLPQATAIGKGIQSDDGVLLDDQLFA